MVRPPRASSANPRPSDGGAHTQSGASTRASRGQTPSQASPVPPSDSPVAVSTVRVRHRRLNVPDAVDRVIPSEVRCPKTCTCLRARARPIPIRGPIRIRIRIRSPPSVRPPRRAPECDEGCTPTRPPLVDSVEQISLLRHCVQPLQKVQAEHGARRRPAHFATLVKIALTQPFVVDAIERRRDGLVGRVEPLPATDIAYNRSSPTAADAPPTRTPDVRFGVEGSAGTIRGRARPTPRLRWRLRRG